MFNIVVSRVKNEDGFIENFIDHYLNLGFDLICLLFEKDEPRTFNNNQVICIEHFKKGDEICEFIPFIIKENINNKIKVDWVLHVDIDEFLFLNNMKIKDYINKFNIDDRVEQFSFKWGCIENYCSINTENDFNNMLYTHKIFTNDSYKSMYKLSAACENSTCPHWVYVKNNQTYHDYDKINDEYCLGIDKKYYLNAIIIHFHTRCLENTFIKALTYSFDDRNNDKNILLENHSIDYLIDNMRKLNLPFEHSTKGQVFEFNELFQLKFETNTIINKDIINQKLQEICNNLDIDINIINNYIQELETTYFNTFLR